MAVPFHTWEDRFRWILSVWHWAGLMIGVFVSAIRLEPSPRLAAAGATAGLFVVITEALPLRVRTVPPLGEILAALGVAVAGTAVGLTGGLDSPYLLFSIAPVFWAAAFLGARSGVVTAFLATGSLAFAARLLDQQLLSSSMVLYAGIYLAIAVTMAQSRRMLKEGQVSARLSTVAEDSASRLGRLEETHSLLSDLSRLADAAELNPVTVGQNVMERLAAIVPYEAGLVALAGSNGPAVVARRGEELVRHHRTVFPIEVADRNVGFVVLTRDREFDSEERLLIEEALRPVTLAFDNILILRDIARRAVREERVRMARELHDDIGPSLASLGLALDLAVLQYPSEPELASHLERLRVSVSALVEDVRSTVADLRQPDSDSLVERARGLAAEAPVGSPPISIEIDERRPPHPRIADDLGSLLTEAIRNALDHSEASAIRVQGFVDGAEGKLIVIDDGKGFDPGSEPPGHFGLIGMSERARRIGATLTIESSSGAGTSVSIRWGDR